MVFCQVGRFLLFTGWPAGNRKRWIDFLRIFVVRRLPLKVRKPAKLLFVSLTLRASLLRGILPPEIKGKLLEDYSALLFLKHFKGEVLYDSSAGGADFVLRDERKREMVMEIGYGAKTHGVKQILHTAKKLKNFIGGMVVSEDAELKPAGEMVIKLPLKFWLMI